MVIFILLLISGVACFNSVSHLLSARIAHDILNENSPEALAWAEDLLREYNDTVSLDNEKDYPFVEAITYADDKRMRGGMYQRYWHFDPLGFSDDGSVTEFTQVPENLTLALPLLTQWVSGWDIHTTQIYKKVMNSARNSGPELEIRGRSLALRLLLHYMGDLHQPLHNIVRYSEKYPDGDKGGNDVEIKYHYKAKNLHAVWDSMVYSYYKTIYRPFNDSSWQDLGEMASELRGKFGI